METRHRIAALAVAVGVFVVGFWLLLAGSALLTKPLSQNVALPIGTFTTWAGMIALPVAVLLMFPGTAAYDRFARNALVALIGLGISWGPVACWLATGHLISPVAEKVFGAARRLATSSGFTPVSLSVFPCCCC